MSYGDENSAPVNEKMRKIRTSSTYLATPTMRMRMPFYVQILIISYDKYSRVNDKAIRAAIYWPEILFSLAKERNHFHICQLDQTLTTITLMATEGLGSIGIKQEREPYGGLESPPLPLTCQAPRQNCGHPRALKRDGTLHELCTLHRRQAQRSGQQRKRLLRILVDALKPENEDRAADTTAAPRRRPRLVLLGNQQTLVLGVVLSELGDFSGISRSML
jgi:hypothetical protein